ncbi:hypothetical protein WI954_22580, partial [Salmonella enterica subsp. enterica serovar Corvallis]
VQLHQQKGMISLSPPTICNSACGNTRLPCVVAAGGLRHGAGFPVRQADAGGGLRRLRQPMEEHHHERQ